ncbi:MAG: exopolysaccharide biosynthesis protein [Glycocaulis sp.]
MENTAHDTGMISRLESIAADAPENGLTLGELTEQLGEQAFGVVLFVLAVPVCMPFLYGIPQIVALPMLAICAQLAMGRETLWLPGRFPARRLSKADLVKTAQGARKWFGWIEHFAAPRLAFLSGAIAHRIAGAMFCLFCLSILVPLPLTNSTPGVALALAALGLINRDGLLVLAGVIIGTGWIIILYGGLIILGPAFIELLIDVLRRALDEGVWAIMLLGVLGLAALAAIVIWRRRQARTKP